MGKAEAEVAGATNGGHVFKGLILLIDLENKTEGTKAYLLTPDPFSSSVMRAALHPYLHY